MPKLENSSSLMWQHGDRVDEDYLHFTPVIKWGGYRATEHLTPALVITLSTRTTSGAKHGGQRRKENIHTIKYRTLVSGGCDGGNWERGFHVFSSIQKYVLFLNPQLLRMCEADCSSPEAQLAAATAGVAVGLGVGLGVDNYWLYLQISTDIYRYLQISTDI